MSAVADKLREARELITPEGAWTQGAFARVPSGRPTWSFGKNAVCWCSLGAINKAFGEGVDTSGPELLLQRALRTDDIADWNDEPGRRQAEVLAAFDKAIELAEQSE